jgi:anti-anti-sigma regulatory factor
VEQASQLQADVLSIPVEATEVIVDCSDAERLHTAVLQVLLSYRSELEKRGASLQIRGANPSVLQCAETAGLGGLFELL